MIVGGNYLSQGGYSQEDRESLEKAIEAREKKYGYKRGTNASLTKPKEYADVPEGDFADPVGYNYPVTKKYVHGAVTYWQHMDHRKAYTDPKARAYITEHIVRAALKFGIEVSYDPKDPDYAKLPESLKKQMKGYDSGQKSMLGDAEAFRAYREYWLEVNRPYILLGMSVSQPSAPTGEPVKTLYVR
jgi:hypothetical protein